MSRIVDDEPVVSILAAGLSERQRRLLAAGRIAWVDDPSQAELALAGGAAALAGTGSSIQGDADEPVQALTGREFEILGYLADGWSNEEIGSRLGIGLSTVKFHLASMYRKMGVNRRTEAVREGQRRGMIEW